MPIKDLDFQELLPNQELEVVEGGEFQSFQISYAWSVQFDDPLAILNRQFGWICAPPPGRDMSAAAGFKGFPWR